MARSGRPTLLTPGLIAEVDRLVRAVVYIETVADYLGISRESIYTWAKRGARETEGIYREFSDTLKKARAAAEIGLIGQIRLGEDGWQSKAWMAERAFRNHWGRHDRLEIDIKSEAEKLGAEYGIEPGKIIELYGGKRRAG